MEAAAYEEALANADKGLELIESETHPLQPDLYLARARALRSLARADDAIDSYRRAIDGFEHAGNVVAGGEASAEVAYVHLWKADSMQAAHVLDRAARMIVNRPSATLLHLKGLNAVSLGVLGRMEEAFVELSRAKETEAHLPDAPCDGILPMCEARLLFSAARMDRAEICAQEAIQRFRASGDLWGEAEVFEPVVATLWLGRVRETEPLLRAAAPIAERVGHTAALWAYKHFRASVDGQRQVRRSPTRRRGSPGRGGSGLGLCGSSEFRVDRLLRGTAG